MWIISQLIIYIDQMNAALFGFSRLWKMQLRSFSGQNPKNSLLSSELLILLLKLVFWVISVISWLKYSYLYLRYLKKWILCQKKPANSRIRFPLEGTHKNMTVGSEMPSQNSITISSWSARNQWPVWWISKCKPCSIVLTMCIAAMYVNMW